jgi:hypothetical protein
MSWDGDRMRAMAGALIAALLFCTAALAQGSTTLDVPVDPPVVSEDQLKAKIEEVGSSAASFREILKQNCEIPSYGPEGQSACKEAVKGFFIYTRDGFVHRQNVFQKQYWLSFGIFFVAVALVFLGMYFAWVQFSLSMRSRVKPDSSGAADDLNTQLSLSMSEVKVNSPVLGVIILIISLAFFYMYLVFVFPVQDTF